ncbi:MAG: serine hydrolase domain-containing protein [Pseudomonadota bacterium]
MWSFLKRGLAPLAMLLGIPSASHAAPRPSGEERAAAIDRLLAPWNKPDAPGVAISVTLDGKVIASAARGFADLEHGVPIKPVSAFHAASLSKQFTAFAIILLEQDGKLSIDHRLADYLPEATGLGPITLRQLLNHTSGLRDQWTLLAMAGWRPEDLVTDDQVLPMILRQRTTNFAPGTAYQYTNSGYSLLAAVVRRVSGKSLNAFCEERIFRQLGMTHTRFPEDISDVVPERVLSYRPTASGYAREVLNYATAGPSGLTTTAEDLSRWALNFEHPVIGGTQALRRMEEQGVLNDGTVNIYALGQEHRPYRGLDTWSHGGRDAGFRAFLLRIPGERFSVSVLSNAADIDSAKIAFAIADIYLADRPAYRAPERLAPTMPDAAQLAGYAGNYELFPGLIFTLSSDGKQLLFGALNDPAPTALPPLSAHSFQLNAKSDLAIEFPDQPAGQAPSFQYRIGLHGALRAKRVTLASFSPATAMSKEFAGRYYSAELDTDYELKVEKDVLTAWHARRPAVRLSAYQPDMFSSSESFFQKVVFQRDAAGRVTGFLLSGPVTENVRFVLRNPPGE